MAQELNVNIVPQSYLPEIRVSQNDNTLRVITVNVVNEDGSPYEIPAGTTATFAGTKPSGLGFTAACAIEDSAVTFAVSDTMSNEAGRFPAEIRFMDGEDRIGTCNVLMRVEPNPHPDDTTDGDREPLVNEITALLQQITEQADRVEEYSGKVLNMTVTAHASDEATVTKTEGEVVNLDFGLPRGPQGPQGIPGEDGEDGVTPEFSIGTVETLAPGERATATITGTDEDPVLNLGIPQGPKGDKGDTGEVSMEDFEKIAVTDEASGSGIVTFPDGANLPAKSLKLTLTPKQDATPWIGTDHDTTPYLNRAMPTQSNDYNRESGVIVGGTVAWNQLAKFTNTTINGITLTANTDGSITLQGTATANATFIFNSQKYPNHVLLYRGCKNGSASTYGIGNSISGVIQTTSDRVYKTASTGTIYNYVTVSSGTDLTTPVTFTPQFFDLTAMLGSTIADYIYSLEQATAGSGIAWLRSYGFLKDDYIPYSQPTLMSVQATAHKTYDSGGNVIGNYALDSNLTLRGIPKLDASNNLYYDGDTYASDGGVTRDFVEVDLANATASTTYTGDVNKTVSITLDPQFPQNYSDYAFISEKYVYRGHVNSASAVNNPDTREIGLYAYHNSQVSDRFRVYIVLPKADSISGKLVYRKATPTTETAQPYTNPQVVDDGGTEEYVTANSVPVGHDSTYSLVCPISGYDEVSATRTGKNLFDKDNYNVLNGYINNGVIVGSYDRSVVRLECEPNTTYTISRKAVATNERFGFGWTEEQPAIGVAVNNVTSIAIQTTVGATITRTLTTGATAKYLAIWMGWENRTAEAETMQIELGSTATAYEPYQGQTYTATLPETVYGGTVDLVSGDVIDTMPDSLWSLKNRTWGKDNSGFYTQINAVKRPPSYGNGGMMCNIYPTLENGLLFNALPDMSCALYNEGPNTNVGMNWFYIRDDRFTTTAELKAYIDGLDEIYFAAESATPQTYQLTPQEIRTLLGTNNVWGDGSNTYIKYIADTRLFILKVLANA